jgi:hypothetical protein
VGAPAVQVSLPVLADHSRRRWILFGRVFSLASARFNSSSFKFCESCSHLQSSTSLSSVRNSTGTLRSLNLDGKLHNTLAEGRGIDAAVGPLYGSKRYGGDVALRAHSMAAVVARQVDPVPMRCGRQARSNWV